MIGKIKMKIGALLSWSRPWLIVMGLLVPTLLHAAPMAVVESLQLPAWVEHNGIGAALAPGMILSGREAGRLQGGRR